jgi:hypothetical protein
MGLHFYRNLWRREGGDLRERSERGRHQHHRVAADVVERAGIVRILEHLGGSIEVPRMCRSRDGP